MLVWEKKMEADLERDDMKSDVAEDDDAWLYGGHGTL